MSESSFWRCSWNIETACLQQSTSHTGISCSSLSPKNKAACRWVPFQVLQGVSLHLRNGFDWMQCDSNGAAHQRQRSVCRLLLHEQGLLIWMLLVHVCPCLHTILYFLQKPTHPSLLFSSQIFVVRLCTAYSYAIWPYSLSAWL